MVPMHQSRAGASLCVLLVTIALSWMQTGAERRGESMRTARMMLNESRAGAPDTLKAVPGRISRLAGKAATALKASVKSDGKPKKPTPEQVWARLRREDRLTEDRKLGEILKRADFDKAFGGNTSKGSAFEMHFPGRKPQFFTREEFFDMMKQRDDVL
eukprot:TRINITY_DN59918_c0_g1_i1.p1 TRINITY_DN59918_c0_g1~~TRINITY_DN59918_c0_g1_i1.p1  ORF type:complete len:158 (+),score=10.45 TRINITY_DN59918_c0_g1_i1:120-593(+)